MDEMLKVFSRIFNTSDGKDLVEFLENLSKETYCQWKRSDSSLNDIFKGQMIAIDDLIQVISTADEKLAQIANKQNEEYEYKANPNF
jgi:hypothetical protein